MSFKEQLRDWLAGLWYDVWHVPYRQVLGLGGVALLTIIRAIWRTEAATSSAIRSSYHTFSPILLVLIVVLLIMIAPRRTY